MSDEPAQPKADRLRVHYCGGCNPQIDRAALVAALREDPAVGGGKHEVTVHVSGCARACASGHELTLAGARVVVVAGECLNGRATPGPMLADTIRRKLEEQ